MLPVAGRLADGRQHLCTAGCFDLPSCGCEEGVNDPLYVPAILHDSSLIPMTQSCTQGRPGAWVNSRPCHVAAPGGIICLQAGVSLCWDPVRSWAVLGWIRVWTGGLQGQAATKATAGSDAI